MTFYIDPLVYPRTNPCWYPVRIAHGEMANVLMFDSHVESLRKEQIELKSFNKDDLNIARWSPRYVDAGGEYKDFNK